MAEYIERDALEGAFDAAAMAFLEKEDHLFDAKSVLAGMSISVGIVLTVPAADVAPVVRGRWVPYNNEQDRGLHYCSICKTQAFNYEDGGEVVEMLSKFCPNCGAKMDKGDK